MKKLKYSKGFTLAEVLITLVIIGIIAAITIPALIQNHTETSTVSKVKKILSTFGQAKMLAENEYGPIIDWDFPTGNNEAALTKFWGYLRPHLSVAADCGVGSNCYQKNGVYLLNGTFHTNYSTSTGYYKAALSDGSVIWFRMPGSGKCTATEATVPNSCAVFYFDVNGDKSPNVVGRDVFSFVFTEGGVYPSLTPECRKDSSGWGCTSVIMKTGKMDYLH